MKGALEKSPADLAEVPDFRKFLTQRQTLIDKFTLINKDELEDILVKAEVSGLSQDNQDLVESVLTSIKKGKYACDYENIKQLLTDNKELKLYDH